MRSLWMIRMLLGSMELSRTTSFMDCVGLSIPNNSTHVGREIYPGIDIFHEKEWKYDKEFGKATFSRTK